MAVESASNLEKKDIFKDVRFFLAEENNEEVKQALKSGGAAREFYISDLVTHVIATDTNFPQLSEAKDCNLTIVQPKWVFLSAACEMLLPCGAFRPESEQLFKGVVACPSQIPINDRDALWAMVTYYGGECQVNLNSNCSHLVIPHPSGAKYECALKHKDTIKIVTPSWIVDSIKEKKRLDERKYMPSKAQIKTETETTSSLLTPDDNDRTTATPLPACVAQDTTVSTPVMAGSKAAATLPSALMSPVSPAVTTAAEGNLAVTTVQSTPSMTTPEADKKSSTRDSNASTETDKTDTEQESVTDVPSGGVKLVENNNEAILENENENEKENKAITNEQDPGISTENQGSSCLAGCVFVISDYQDRMDPSILNTWIEVVQQHGGKVSPIYSNQCTHLLCLNQHGDFYQKAISDGKRIVTAHWLNDVLIAKDMFPPSNPLHLPVPFKDKVNQCKTMVITVTGYTGAERSLLKNMIFIIGARYTGYLTRANTHIICKSSSGDKYTKAREWGIFCVNAKWLGDIVTTGYPSPCNLVRYSTLGEPNELEITKDLLVRELILPWQTLADGSKTEMPTNSGKRKFGEQSTPENGQLKKARRTSSPANTEKPEGPKVLFTGIIPSEVSRLTEIIANLGGVVVTSVKDCTHLVTRKIIRTVKFLCAISVAKYVVMPEWIDKSQQSNTFLEPSEFTVKDAFSEDIYDMDLVTSLQRARTRPLLQDILVYVTQNVEPSPSSMKEIIQCAGGQVLPSVPSQQYLTELKQKAVEKGSPVLLIISCEKDYQLCSEFIRKGFDNDGG
ncbi:PAX-interacting protein 1-like [Oculina patagonica]